MIARLMISRLLISILAVAALSHVSVATAQVFPTSFQQSIDNGDLALEPFLVQSSPLFQRYDYFDSNFRQMHLLRYSIGGDAGNVTTGDFPSQTPFFGTAWLGLQNEYDLSSEIIQMTLYTEQVLPGSNLQQTDDISLTLSTEALLAGTGSFFDNFDGTPEDNGLDSDGPLVCIAPGCFVGAEFNLLNVAYSEIGGVAIAGFPTLFPGVSPPINGELLYSEFTGFPGFEPDGDLAFDQRSNFIVGAVPEPGSGLLLFFSALLAMSLRRKRRLFA